MIQNKNKKKKRKNNLIATNLPGFYKNKNTGIIINKNKNELALVKNAVKNAKLANENKEKVEKLEDEVKQLKELLLQVIERK
jgi:hypothetical protein